MPGTIVRSLCMELPRGYVYTRAPVRGGGDGGERRKRVGNAVSAPEGGDLICQACHPDLMFRVRMSLNPCQDPDLMSSSSIWS